MTCEETRQSLSLYVDDCVSLPARVAVDEHLDRCPVCRAEVAELRSLTRRLSLMTRPTPPEDLVGTITDILAIEAAARRQSPKIPLSRRIARLGKKDRVRRFCVDALSLGFPCVPTLAGGCTCERGSCPARHPKR